MPVLDGGWWIGIAANDPGSAGDESTDVQESEEAEVGRALTVIVVAKRWRRAWQMMMIG